MMKKDIETNERIESFLKGTLSEEDMKHVRDRMAEDASFADQVEVHRHLHDLIRDSVYLGVRDELKKVHHNKIRVSKKIRRITGFGSAGLIVGLAVVFFVLRKPGPGNAGPEETLVPARPQVMEQPVTGDVPTIDPSPGDGTGIRTAGRDGQDGGQTGRGSATMGTDNGAGRETTAQQQEKPAEGLATDTTFDGSKDAGGGPVSAPGSNDRVPGQDTGRQEELTPGIVQKDDTPANVSQRDLILMDTTSLNAGQNGDRTAGTTKPASGEADCSKVVIEGILSIEVSCNNEPTGRILVDRQSLRGGSPPYSFSLNRKTYTDSFVFSALYPGNYAVYARDAAGCIKLLQNAFVGSEDCTTEYESAFAPGKGQVWTVPVRENGTGTLIIYSTAGNVVYRVPVSGDEETVWQGETVSGQGLPMGLYQFEIRYDDGTVFIGTVSLIR